MPFLDGKTTARLLLEGAFLDRGMAAFAPVLSEEDAEAVRAFIVYQANQ